MSNLEGDATIVVLVGGDNPVITWQFLQNDIPDDQEPEPEDIFDLTGSVLHLKITYLGRVFVDKNTADDPDYMTIDIPSGSLEWRPTVEETRALPRGCIATYGIENREGGYQTPWLGGVVEAVEYPNND
jgi:hypothetical protein